MPLTRYLRMLVLAISGLLLGAPIASAQRGHAHHAVTVAHHHHVRARHHAAHAAVRGAPPAPRIVARPAMPFPEAVWTSGYWSWNGRSYVWVEGQWVRPVPGHRWSPWRWEERHGTWILIPGGWIPIHE